MATYDLLRSPTVDTGDGTVIATGVAEALSMEQVDTPGEGTWRYWARTDEGGAKSEWAGPATVTVGEPAPLAIWISKDELDTIPITGGDPRVTHWDTMKSTADGTWNPWDIVVLNDANIQALAGALVYARLFPDPDATPYRAKVADAIADAIAAGVDTNTTNTIRARNTMALAVCGDLINLATYDPTLHSQLQTFLDLAITATSTTGGSVEGKDVRPQLGQAKWRNSNTANMSRSSCLAAALYMEDAALVTEVISTQRGHLGDVAHYNEFIYSDGQNAHSWMPDPADPATFRGVLGVGVVKDGVSLDGVYPEDYARNGAWDPPSNAPPPESTSYVGIGQEGIITTQMLCVRKVGTSANGWADGGALRSLESWERFVALHGYEWALGTSREWVLPLANYLYGTTYALDYQRNALGGSGAQCGWTQWTHQGRSL